MFTQVHVVQSFPLSNLNSDENGKPRITNYGGVERAFVSSQASRRAIRQSCMFRDMAGGPAAIRTKRLVPNIIEELARDNIEGEWAEPRATSIVENLYDKMSQDKDKKRETQGLTFVSDEEIAAIVRFLAEAYRRDAEPDIKSFCKEQVDLLKQGTLNPDIALFGRLLMHNPALNIEGVLQVEAPISTHEAHLEHHKNVAVDDLKPDDEHGAAWLGPTPLVSATYYRFANIYWDGLVRNFGGDVDRAMHTIAAFLWAFVLVPPTCKKNPQIGMHFPHFVMGVTRPYNRGHSFANAFHKPVRGRDRRGEPTGYIGPSIAAICDFWNRMELAYLQHASLSQGSPGIAVLNPMDYELPAPDLAGATVKDMPGWIDRITAPLGKA